MHKEQIKVFAISYIVNILSLMGLSENFVTATFFSLNDIDKETKLHISLPEIQLVLVVTAITYLFLGNVLEYVKNPEIKIIIPLIAIFGLMKISVRYINSIYLGWHL